MHLSIEHHGFNDKLLMYKCNRRSRCICLKLLHHNTTIQPPFNCVFDEHKYNDKILRSFCSLKISTFIQNQLQKIASPPPQGSCCRPPTHPPPTPPPPPRTFLLLCSSQPPARRSLVPRPHPSVPRPPTADNQV
jgi:hypothetical protein